MTIMTNVQYNILHSAHHGDIRLSISILTNYVGNIALQTKTETAQRQNNKTKTLHKRPHK